MKKILGIIIIIVIALSMVSCKSSSNHNGKYYAYENDVKVENDWIEIKDSKWNNNDGVTGTVKIKGTEITFSYTFLGTEMQYVGTIQDSVLTYVEDGETFIYKRD